MSKKEHNWAAGCLTLVITLAVLFGGQLLWNQYAIAKPMHKVLQGIDGVKAVSVGSLNEQGKSTDEVKVNIQLSHVSNLQKLYGEITDGLKQINSGKKYDIVIQDNRTPELEQFYYSIHYHIQEAIFNGNFSTMAERIEVKADKAGIAVRSYVDTKNIYIMMTKGTDEMYVVIARTSSNQEVK